MDNLKLIGLIKENKDNKDIICIPMNIIINKINYIKNIYEIKKEEIGKEIQILNNGYITKDDRFIKKNDKIEKEIKVIINGEIKENILNYKFKKEGKYKIYYISDNILYFFEYVIHQRLEIFYH